MEPMEVRMSHEELEWAERVLEGSPEFCRKMEEYGVPTSGDKLNNSGEPKNPQVQPPTDG